MNLNKKLVTELSVDNKVVFLRLDLNVPIINGKITSTKRIDASLPTIKYLIDNNAKIVILSHLGRPSSLDNLKDESFSLKLVAHELAQKVGTLTPKVSFVNASRGSKVETMISDMNPREILVLENTRFNDVDKETGQLVNHESSNNYDLANYWANLCDVFVNDAYGAAHRKHASTYGIAELQKNNAIGFLMHKEITELTSIVNKPIRPLTVIFGGAKVSDKLLAVESALQKADKVIISGGMAYTFLAAQGFDMGNSKVEVDLIPLAKKLLKENSDKIVVSSDFLCAPTFQDVPPIYKTKEDGLNGLIGLDIGEKSVKDFSRIINNSNSILWNGPMGVTEFNHYTIGTNKICNAIAQRTKLGAYTIIGGGDSAAAAEKLRKEDGFSWISTGGGASLVLLSGKELVAIEPIQESNVKKDNKEIDKLILDNKYAQEFLMNSVPSGLKKEVKNKKYFDDLAHSNPLVAKNKTNDNPMYSDKPIKELLSELKSNNNYNVGSGDPLSVYSLKPIIIKQSNNNDQESYESLKQKALRDAANSFDEINRQQQEKIAQLSKQLEEKTVELKNSNNNPEVQYVENPINEEQAELLRQQQAKIDEQQKIIDEQQKALEQLANNPQLVQENQNPLDKEQLALLEQQAQKIAEQQKIIDEQQKALEQLANNEASFEPAILVNEEDKEKLEQQAQKIAEQEQLLEEQRLLLEQLSNQPAVIRNIENPINEEQAELLKQQQAKIDEQQKIIEELSNKPLPAPIVIDNEEEKQRLEEKAKQLEKQSLINKEQEEINKLEKERLEDLANELAEQRRMLQQLTDELENAVDNANKERQQRLAEEARRFDQIQKANQQKLNAEARKLHEKQKALEEANKKEAERLANEAKKLEEVKKAEQEKIALEAKKLEEQDRLAKEKLRMNEIANKAEQDRLAYQAKKLEERERLAEATRKAAESANKAEQDRLAKEEKRIKEDKKAAEEATKKAEQAKKAAEEAQLKLNLKSKLIKQISKDELEKRQQQKFVVDNNVSKHDKDVKTIMISLEKDLIEKIVKQEKEIIFLKRLPVQKVERVLIYSVKPIGKVVGEFDLKSTRVMTKTSSWKEYGSRSIFKKKEFDEYFADHKDVKVMELDGFIPYSKPRPLSDFDLNKGPAGFCYLK